MADPKAPGDGYDVLINRLATMERRMDELEISTGTQRNRTTANLPIPGVGTATTTNIGLLSSSWITYATVTIPVPLGKGTATIMAFANGAFLDMTSGGVTALSARIVIGDTNISPAAPGAKDAGASRVNNIVQLGYSAVLTGIDTTVKAELQVNPLNASAFPAQAQNFASITINAAFTA
ncbi:hypothetical protein ACL9RL_09285 [Plantibacter sp. Mn2098]|uniref:hypothetical protein n=1 Tax=Plantibacter sp. Mn2098 TaxID=3395266 RepID=UPI003BC623DF